MFPRFKKKGQGDSFRYPDARQIKLDQTNSRIFLPKLAWMRYRNSREVLGAVKNATVSLHKLSRQISKNHAIVCVEKLQVGNMSRSAAGTPEAPGKNVRAKSGLNKSILDQGWFEFRRQLDYKLAWNGGWLIAVPAQNTSRRCPACSHVLSENRQAQAEFRCVECGFAQNADLVGAVDILRGGLARLACQANELARRQQEASEALLAQ